MDRVVAGKSNKVIAAELGLSMKTVEVHRKRVMDKMGAESLADLIRLVVLTSKKRS
jgi:FixJ family two-component response regulator